MIAPSRDVSRTLPDHYGSRSYVALRIPLVVGSVLVIGCFVGRFRAHKNTTAQTPPQKTPPHHHKNTTTKTPPHKPALNPGQTRSKSRSYADPHRSLRIPNVRTLTDPVGGSSLSATLCRPSCRLRVRYVLCRLSCRPSSRACCRPSRVRRLSSDLVMPERRT